MSVNTVAILSPGDMGYAVGRSLGEHGLDVVTCLRDRSERTRGLALRGNIRDLPTFEDMVSEADLVLSILVPAQAVGVAQQVADALRNTGSRAFFADCNAVSPQTTATMEAIVDAADGRYIDASIIGLPPGPDRSPRFYVSGSNADTMMDLDGKGIVVRHLGDTIGRASGIKMCYAALTKGTWALHMALLTAAEAMGLSDELQAEFSSSQPDRMDRMQTDLPGLPANAHRWVGEMQEIAATFEHVGVTPLLHQGAAEVFNLLGTTPFAEETPETVDRKRTLQQTISVVAQSLPARVVTTD